MEPHAQRPKIAWNKGIPITEVARKKLSDSLKGRIAWNKGLKGVMPTPWNKGLKGIYVPTEETRKRLSDKLKGRPSPNFKGGYKITSKGYRQIWLKFSHKYVLEHRFIMENHLGRTLEPNELVHHRDGNKLNNAIDNLEVLSWSKHSLDHQPKKLGKIHICSICRNNKKLHSIKYFCCRPCYVRFYLHKTTLVKII